MNRKGIVWGSEMWWLCCITSFTLLMEPKLHTVQCYLQVLLGKNSFISWSLTSFSFTITTGEDNQRNTCQTHRLIPVIKVICLVRIKNKTLTTYLFYLQSNILTYLINILFLKNQINPHSSGRKSTQIFIYQIFYIRKSANTTE